MVSMGWPDKRKVILILLGKTAAQAILNFSFLVFVSSLAQPVPLLATICLLNDPALVARSKALLSSKGSVAGRKDAHPEIIRKKAVI